MKSYSYKVNRFCCYISMFGAVVCAVSDQPKLMLLNFFFAVWNWYIGEWKRGKENEENDNNKSDGSNSTSSKEDNTEDKE